MVSGAEELLRDFEINESSYLEAWSYLILGFDNPRVVGKALFHNFRGLTPITSAHEVRNLLDKVDIIIRGIKKLMSVKLMTPFQLLLLIMFHVSSTPVGSKNTEAILNQR